MKLEYSKVRGFNYQPGYAYNSYEAWRFFDPEVFQRDFELGKRYFPGINTVRLWLSYEAFRYEEDRQAANFETVLSICDSFGFRVIPVLFNRWHDAVMDNGGIYYNQIITGSCWCAGQNIFDSYIQKIVSAHKTDGRIFLWDICNEPFSYGDNQEAAAFIRPYELKWLEKLYIMGKESGAVQPFGISHASPCVEAMKEIAHISDVFLVHPYFFYSDVEFNDASEDKCVEILASLKQTAEQLGKPILTTETCWGSLIDERRADIIRHTLSAHRRAGIGFIVHALAYSHVADLHDPDDGIVGNPGNLCFIRRDGSLRPGHDVFNNY